MRCQHTACPYRHRAQVGGTNSKLLATGQMGNMPVVGGKQPFMISECPQGRRSSEGLHAQYFPSSHAFALLSTTDDLPVVFAVVATTQHAKCWNLWDTPHIMTSHCPRSTSLPRPPCSRALRHTPAVGECCRQCLFPGSAGTCVYAARMHTPALPLVSAVRFSSALHVPVC